jgi:hypothetical protein
VAKYGSFFQPLGTSLVILGQDTYARQSNLSVARFFLLANGLWIVFIVLYHLSSVEHYCSKCFNLTRLFIPYSLTRKAIVNNCTYVLGKA